MQALERTRNIPGVEDVALADWLPLLETSGYASPGFTIAGQTVSTASEKPTVLRQSISPNYFGLMGIPVLRGRGVTAHDTSSNAWIVVLNEAMARRFWKNGADRPQYQPRRFARGKAAADCRSRWQRTSVLADDDPPSPRSTSLTNNCQYASRAAGRRRGSTRA